MSHHLRDLSKCFGVALTERSGKSIKLTAAGKELVRIAREHFFALQSFHDRISKSVPTLRFAAGDSLLQSLLVPAVGRARRPGYPVRFELSNLRTVEIVEQLLDRRIDYGLLQSDAVENPLEQMLICEQTYAIFVPQRLVPTRGMLTVKNALFKCPHAAIGGDGQLLKQIKKLAEEMGEVFAPELTCDSIGQCVAAVETGSFAAVLPIQAWTPPSEREFVVVEEDSLDVLKQKIVLAWHPRTTESFGPEAVKIQEAIVNALIQPDIKSPNTTS